MGALTLWFFVVFAVSFGGLVWLAFVVFLGGSCLCWLWWVALVLFLFFGLSLFGRLDAGDEWWFCEGLGVLSLLGLLCFWGDFLSFGVGCFVLVLLSCVFR